MMFIPTSMTVGVYNIVKTLNGMDGWVGGWVMDGWVDGLTDTQTDP
jgi:hypothetical protein